ncbi:efflux RND transporter periplasmic adaptor subunit [Novipirellula maiorica]|nr:efflux RND transporter periplasmic adaptor subunit [Rhodopirellula maiorica]
MRPKLSKVPLPAIQATIGLIVVVVVGVTYSMWWPPLSSWVDATLSSQRGGEVAGGDDHASHSTSAAAEVTSLELTPQARKNLGLTPKYLRPVELSNYRRSITVPAVVVAKPGRSSIVVSSPLNGVVTHVHAVTGEAVMPGDLLFEVRLTYEDLVETQTAYLKTISELEVENREIARLEDATRSGAISGKQLLERRYAKEKLEAFAKSQREALRLHGLSDRQIDAIARDGKLMGDLQIVAPDVDSHDEDEELHLSQVSLRPVSYTKPLPLPQIASRSQSSKKLLVIDDLSVHKGQAITAGEKLCSLSDYTQLFIEGKAFENDIAAISEAAQQGWTVDAVFSGSKGQEVVSGLKLVFVSNSIDSDSRTLSLFVELPNEMMRDVKNDEGQRFVSWKYRIGQRLELRVPVEQWENQIVLPVEAVVKEGADWFVFQQNGKTFTRVPVHVRHRGQDAVVIANDGSIYPGDVIARKAAHQMQMAIKNKSGGGADPHAGHSH